MQITTHTSRTRRTTQLWLGCITFLSLAAGAEAQTYYYYPSQPTPAYNTRGAFRGQGLRYKYPSQYYQTTYAAPAYQAPQYYQATAYDPNVQTVSYTQPIPETIPAPAAEPTVAAAPATAAPATVAAAPETTQPAPTAAPAGDPYGFLNWLNATRAAYGLSAVGYDPNLSSWAAVNNDHQAASGIGHFVMGPARRQNSAMGGFPGIESMWMASPAHRAALLDPTIRWIGIAGLGAYWTFNAN